VVTLVGSVDALRAIESVQTQQIDVTEASAAVNRQAPLVVPEGVSVVGSGTVRVNVRIASLVVLQTISVPITVESLPPGLQVLSPLPAIQVIIRGSSATLRLTDLTQVRATVNLAGRDVGVHEVPVNLSLPGDMTLESFAPRSFAVRLGGTESATPSTQATTTREDAG
jgi:YbbR domain-containing protein